MPFEEIKIAWLLPPFLLALVGLYRCGGAVAPVTSILGVLIAIVVPVFAPPWMWSIAKEHQFDYVGSLAFVFPISPGYLLFAIAAVSSVWLARALRPVVVGALIGHLPAMILATLGCYSQMATI